jgi:hypothetical protein
VGPLIARAHPEGGAASESSWQSRAGRRRVSISNDDARCAIVIQW